MNMSDEEEYLYVETGGLGLEHKKTAFKIKRMIEKNFGVYAEVVDSSGDEVVEEED